MVNSVKRLRSKNTPTEYSLFSIALVILFYIFISDDDDDDDNDDDDEQVVAPKRQGLLEAEVIYEESMAKLRVKQAELQAVTAKLQNLNDQLSFKQEQKRV